MKPTLKRLSQDYQSIVSMVQVLITHYHLNTPRLIIYALLPPDYYDTERYIRQVCSLTNIGGNEWIAVNDRNLHILMWALAIVYWNNH